MIPLETTPVYDQSILGSNKSEIGDDFPTLIVPLRTLE